MYFTVANIREEFIRKLNDAEFVTDKTNCKTIEIVGATFIANEPTIFGKVNEDYIRKELDWYLSQSLNVGDLEDTPQIWQKVASKNGEINSNYGFLVFNEDNCLQYWNVLNELQRNTDSRRAIMIYTRPTMHYDYNRDGMSDFICTNTVQYLVRNNKLDVVVNMRSNDAVFGYKNDYAWQKWVQEKLAKDLHIECGNIIWQVGSLHVYERHFHLVK